VKAKKSFCLQKPVLYRFLALFLAIKDCTKELLFEKMAIITHTPSLPLRLSKP
jgi:hypothetical protein